MSLNSFFGYLAQQITETYDTIHQWSFTDFAETTPSVDFKSANALESLVPITSVPQTHTEPPFAGGHCAFYGSARGCRFGTNCKYRHEDVARVQVCKYWESKNQCKFGNKCKFRHFITEDEKLSRYLRNLQASAGNKQPSWCDVKSFENKSFEFKFDEYKTGKIELFRKWSNKISFQMKKRIFSDWDDDIDAVMEGFVAFDKRKNKLQLLTQNIFIHKRTELDGDSYGSNIVPATTVLERDYFIQSYWLKEFENVFYCVCDDISDDIMIHILSFIGFPIFQQDSVYFFILDCFCFEFSLDIDAKDVWEIQDVILRNAFRDNWSIVDKKYESIKRLIKH